MKNQSPKNSFEPHSFPLISDAAGSLGDRHEQFVIAVGHSGLEQQIRVRFARGFIPKTVFGSPATQTLIDRLHLDRVLRQLRGWPHSCEDPSKAPSASAQSQDEQTAGTIDEGNSKTDQGRWGLSRWSILFLPGCGQVETRRRHTVERAKANEYGAAARDETST